MAKSQRKRGRTDAVAHVDKATLAALARVSGGTEFVAASAVADAMREGGYIGATGLGAGQRLSRLARDGRCDSQPGPDGAHRYRSLP